MSSARGSSFFDGALFDSDAGGHSEAARVPQQLVCFAFDTLYCHHENNFGSPLFGVLAFLRFLLGRGYKVAIVSKTYNTDAVYGWFEQNGFCPYLDSSLKVIGNDFGGNGVCSDTNMLLKYAVEESFSAVVPMLIGCLPDFSGYEVLFYDDALDSHLSALAAGVHTISVPKGKFMDGFWQRERVLWQQLIEKTQTDSFVSGVREVHLRSEFYGSADYCCHAHTHLLQQVTAGMTTVVPWQMVALDDEKVSYYCRLAKPIAGIAQFKEFVGSAYNKREHLSSLLQIRISPQRGEICLSFAWYPSALRRQTLSFLEWYNKAHNGQLRYSIDTSSASTQHQKQCVTVFPFTSFAEAQAFKNEMIEQIGQCLCDDATVGYNIYGYQVNYREDTGEIVATHRMAQLPVYSKELGTICQEQVQTPAEPRYDIGNDQVSYLQDIKKETVVRQKGCLLIFSQQSYPKRKQAQVEPSRDDDSPVSSEASPVTGGVESGLNFAT